MVLMSAYLLMDRQVQEKLIQWYVTNFMYILIFLSYSIKFYFIFLQSGPNGATNESLGVNYRALNDLFNISSSRQSSIVYEIGVQIIEIYNEQVRDLLSTDTSVKKYPFLNRYSKFIVYMNFLLRIWILCCQ